MIYINEDYVIDDRYDYRVANGQLQRGVLVRTRVGWYQTAALGGWRVIGERSDPFHFDVVLRQRLGEFTTFLRDQR